MQNTISTQMKLLALSLCSTFVIGCGGKQPYLQGIPVVGIDGKIVEAQARPAQEMPVAKKVTEVSTKDVNQLPAAGAHKKTGPSAPAQTVRTERTITTTETTYAIKEEQKAGVVYGATMLMDQGATDPKMLVVGPATTDLSTFDGKPVISPSTAAVVGEFVKDVGVGLGTLGMGAGAMTMAIKYETPEADKTYVNQNGGSVSATATGGTGGQGGQGGSATATGGAGGAGGSVTNTNTNANSNTNSNSNSNSNTNSNQQTQGQTTDVGVDINNSNTNNNSNQQTQNQDQNQQQEAGAVVGIGGGDCPTGDCQPSLNWLKPRYDMLMGTTKTNRVYAHQKAERSPVPVVTLLPGTRALNF